jgi:hypothetical protein
VANERQRAALPWRASPAFGEGDVEHGRWSEPASSRALSFRVSILPPRSLLWLTLALASACSSAHGGSSAAPPRATTSQPSADPVDPPPTPAPVAEDQPRQPTASHALSAARVFYLGHSLQNHQVPAMVEDLAHDASLVNTYQVQIGLGANLQWQWMHPEGAQGSIARDVLPVTPFDVFVMTEAVPLESQIRWADSVGYAARYAELARQGNPDVQVYLYETWHSRNDTSSLAEWRAHLTSDLPMWESIVDGANQAYEGRDILVIPAGQAMGLLYDEIAAGRVPGLTTIETLFHDDIHLNDVGWYFIACVQYATIYGRSPVGRTRTTSPHEDFGDYEPPPLEAVPAMQDIAWRAVIGYPRSGVHG